MRSVAVFAALALLFVAASARAGDEVLRLTWSAPAGCPRGEDVRSATLRETAAQHANPGGVLEVLEAEARVEQKDPTVAGGSGWTVRLKTRRGTAIGEREIEASTCDGVVEATVVVLALALVPPAAADDEPPAIAPVPAPAGRDAPAPTRGTGEEHHALAIGAAVAGDASTLPAATPGGSLTLAWAPGRLRLELDARRWASQSQSLSATAFGARFAMTSLGARACWAALRAGGFELAPCAGSDVHLVSADGYGADANYSASAEWTTVTGGALGRFSLASWLALRARGEAFVPLSRPTFVVQNEGAIHRPPSIGAAATLGVEVLFL